MKTERRHELATNVLADWLGAKIEEVRPYSTAILATLLGIVVAGGAFLYMNRRSGDRVARDWKQYFAALDESLKSGETDSLRDVAESLGGSDAGLWARLSLADNQLSKGLEQLFSNRAEAQKLLRSAVDNYKQVREDAPARSFLDERATLGLAQGYESLNELGKATEEYESIKSKWPESTFVAEADKRLSDLKKPSTKAFYDWFAKQDPKPSKSGEPGEPGAKPKFDMGNLDDEHPFDSALKVDENDSPNRESKNEAGDDAGASSLKRTPDDEELTPDVLTEGSGDRPVDAEPASDDAAEEASSKSTQP